MIVDGKILLCDVCEARKVYDETKPLPERCWNRKCRSWRWNNGGEDRRTWPRVPPNSIPPAQR